MKKRILAIVLSTVMALSMVACGGAKTEEAPAAEAPAATEEAPAEEAPAAEAAGYSFQVLVKSFQSSYWQAAVIGIDKAAAELSPIPFRFRRNPQASCPRKQCRSRELFPKGSPPRCLQRSKFQQR